MTKKDNKLANLLANLRVESAVAKKSTPKRLKHTYDEELFHALHHKAAEIFENHIKHVTHEERALDPDGYISHRVDYLVLHKEMLNMNPSYQSLYDLIKDSFKFVDECYLHHLRKGK